MEKTAFSKSYLFRRFSVELRDRDSAVFYAALSAAFPGEASFLFRRNKQVDPAFLPSTEVMGFEPFETIRTQGGKTAIDGITGRSESAKDPFTVVSERIRPFVREEAGSDFCGGAFGYFGFDSIRLVERVLATNQKRSEHDFEAEFFLFRKFVVLDHLAGRITVLSNENEVELERFTSAVREIFDSLPRAASVPSTKDAATLEYRSMLGFERHQSGVAKLKEHIAAGDIFQAVLSERFETPFTGEPLELFRILCGMNPAPYQFILNSGPRAFLGCSPEMLLKIDGKRMESHPIAGTRPRGATPEEEAKRERQLRENVKENAEHLMLVDLARNDLSRVARPGSVRLQKFSELKKFGSVMHLVSTVIGDRRPEVDAVQALAACFPAGTLSGAPKIRAIQLISEIEPESRGFYGGAVVLAGFNGDLDSCISIRSIAVVGGVARVQAGGGVVLDSRPDMEYAEIQQKSALARKAVAAGVSS